jgi:DNA-binding transcriptional ArsR family regulator
MVTETEITLDRKVFEALSSETRIRILKHVKNKGMTVTELSKILGTSKSTVSQHLDKLVEAGLVKKSDEGRKWVHYELTEKGKKILQGRLRVRILLHIGWLTLIGGVVELLMFIKWMLSLPSLNYRPIKTPYFPIIINNPQFLVGVGLILIGLVIVIFTYRKYRNFL